ncbi:hypothetical protein D769_04334 [Cupriavidus sp. HMR-1]|uniref:hypothetical protein n=1 Tax=Cupriavidus sp. HMR-1 TaxID=1249621 RepID=UPI0002A3D5AD|nr:hypothetical protein [Cupriavidus sp. HMR-1]ELA00627.1 hypothetical protein D769_04334 [Cupriavidus sp. HMR-1]
MPRAPKPERRLSYVVLDVKTEERAGKPQLGRPPKVYKDEDFAALRERKRNVPASDVRAPIYRASGDDSSGFRHGNYNPGPPVERNCPICRQQFTPAAAGEGKCPSCKAAESAQAAAMSGTYRPAFRGALPEPAPATTEPQARPCHRRGGGSGSAGRYRLVLDIADGAAGTYSLVSAWPASAPQLRWFQPVASEDVIVTRDGRRFDVGLSLEDLFRRAYQLGNAIHHDRYRLLVDGPDITCHCNGLSELQRAAILVRVYGEFWGAMQGAIYGVEIAGLMARVGLKLGHGDSLQEGKA